jgi:hypothetical protein
MTPPPRDPRKFSWDADEDIVWGPPAIDREAVEADSMIVDSETGPIIRAKTQQERDQRDRRRNE